MDRKHVRTSKFLSLVLRHQPDAAGIELDAHGWVAVDVLLDALAARGRSLTREQLDEVVFTNDKQRFAYSEDGLRIRASQGHSVAVELGLEALEPPAVLHHGTAERFLEVILREGLSKMSRQHVHLSADLATATRVGARHGRPVVLDVDAGAMFAAGHVFHRSANGVWLTESVPVTYLSLNEMQTA